MTQPSPPAPWLEIVPRETGDVLLGTLPAAPAGVIAVPLSGATAYVDPTAPESLPAVVAGDGTDVPVLLDELFGIDLGDRGVAAAEVQPAVLTMATDALVRYGVREWLWSTGTLPLDRGTLGVERALAADAAEHLLDRDGTGTPAVADLAPVALALARTLTRTGGDGAWPGLSGLLDESLTAVRRHLAPDDPRSERLTHESELRSAARAFATGPLDWDRWPNLVESGRPRTAVHAGPVGSVGGPFDGQAGVDWAYVPPGVLDPAEDAVTWRTSEARDGSVRVVVEVAAHRWPSTSGMLRRLVADDPDALRALDALSGGPPSLDLGFRIYVAGFPLPVADGRLDLQPDGRSWRGVAEVPDRVLRGREAVHVLVHALGRRARPRVGPAGLAAEALRWAARGLSLLRVSLVAGASLRDGVREPWERARELYGVVAQSGGPEAGLALRQQARCLAMIVAYLEATGETRTRRLRAELASVASRTEARDVAVPDLSDPAWAPTVAEQGLLVRGRA